MLPFPKLQLPPPLPTLLLIPSPFPPIRTDLETIPCLLYNLLTRMAPRMPDTWPKPRPTWQDRLEDCALRKQVFLLRVQLKVCRPCCFR